MNLKLYPIAIKTISLILLIFSTACSTITVEDYKDRTPYFAIEKFFTGRVTAKGVFINRSGLMQREFEMIADGKWDENDKVLTIEEVLTFKDGEIVNRTYVITRQNENTWSLESEDLVGVGTIKSSGNALNWKYTLKQKVGDAVYHLDFDDWMYLYDDNTVINKAVASWYGIHAGEVILQAIKLN